MDPFLFSVRLFTLDSQRLVHIIRTPDEDPFEQAEVLAGFLSPPQFAFTSLQQNVYWQGTTCTLATR